MFQESWFEGVVTCKKNDTLEVVIEKIVKAEVISSNSVKVVWDICQY